MFLRNRNSQMDIPVDRILINPDQPRKAFPDKELEELASSIREFGVIQPIIVKRSGEEYILIAGERRLRASIMAGHNKIPSIIREADEKDMALIALVENVQRENLSFIEEASAYRSLMLDYGLTQDEIAKKVGKQQSTISNKIRLLALPDELIAAITENRLTERHARALLKVNDNIQRKHILEKIISHGLNVKQTEKLIVDFLEKTEEERRKAEKLRFISYKIYINTIKKAFSTIQEIETAAEYHQNDKGDHLEIRILIPKKAG